jgi:catechol 2,3-dioxygenase-like lactoylglutathione lyase family enzyme
VTAVATTCSPRLTGLRPMLAVTDLRRTMAFYERLGFRIAGVFGDPEPVWCELVRDNVAMMFNAPPRERVERDVPAKSRDYQVFYFNPSDVAALHAAWKAAGLPVTDLRVTIYRMKEFELRDPDGYWLWFGQETSEPPTVQE